MKEILPAFLSCQGPTLNDDEKRLFAKYNPLGICLFSRFCENVKSREQLRKLVQEVCEVIGRDDVLFAIDQEGGRVRRMLDPEFTPLAPQVALESEETAVEHAYLAAYDLKSCGVNVNFAPVLDLCFENTSKVLQNRCFAGDERQAAQLGRAMIETYLENGICPCVKHLPGHGHALTDPHLSLPVVDLNIDELSKDIYPFKFNNFAPMGMVAHILFSKVDNKNPATLSKKVIAEIIRGLIGFEGLLVSDAIVMRALSGSIEEKAATAVAAGCEVVCLGNADFAANVALCKSGIVMSDKTKERLDKVYNIIKKSGNFANYEYIKNKYCMNLKNILSYDYEYDATEVLNQMKKQ